MNGTKYILIDKRKIISLNGFLFRSGPQPDKVFHTLGASKFVALTYVKFANLLMIRLLQCESAGREGKIEKVRKIERRRFNSKVCLLPLYEKNEKEFIYEYRYIKVPHFQHVLSIEFIYFGTEKNIIYK